MANAFVYKTNQDAHLQAARTADLLHCANRLYARGADGDERHIEALVDIAAELAQQLANMLDAGEVSEVKHA
ncbi:hypothetical protein [Yersinia proxima]|uniref:hypothetical protein n=1 Tax=Yersinia proxima TaxID=2890316 RepID=UPI001D0F4EB8|nr:hypothetical protein [Yersinia proxima]